MISPIAFIPSNAGNSTRIKSLLELIDADIDYLHVLMEDGNAEEMEKSTLIDNYFRFPYAPDLTINSRIKFVLRRSLDAFNMAYIPYKIDEYCDISVCKNVREFCDVHKYDCVIIEYVFLSRIFDFIDSDVIKILDTHDIFTDRQKKYVDDRCKWFYTTKEEEIKGFDRADFVLAIQEKEKKLIQSLTSKPIVKTIGHKVEINESDTVKNHNLLYVASNNKQNIFGLKGFVENVLWRIKEQVPDVKLIVAGSISKGIDFDGNEDILVTGYFEKKIDVYKLASVVINPTPYGTGLKIKTIEALGYGKALVGTESATEGLDSNNNTNFIAVKSEIEFADEIIKLLSDYDKIEMYSRNALLYSKAYNESVQNSVTTLINQARELKESKL